MRFVRLFSLETGQPLLLHYRTAQGEQEVERILSAGETDQVSLRIVGPHLYVFNPNGVISYNLDHPNETWKFEITDHESSGPRVTCAIISSARSSWLSW